MNRNQIYFELFKKYQDMYDELLTDVKKGALEKKYARGGECIHRGFFCPSPIFDIVVGGANRGRLLKTQRSMETADYCYTFSKGNLVMADAYVFLKGKGRVLYNREYILNDGDIEIAPLYNVLPDSIIRIAGITICEYLPCNMQLRSGRKILRYIRVHALTYELDTLLPKDLDINVETYSYNHDGLIACSTLENISYGNVQLRSYAFNHDDEGKIISYKVLNGKNCNLSSDYAVPKSMQRII